MPKRVILLTVDALGANHVGWLGYERDTTPNLDTYAAQGLSFTNCIAQSSHTRESMFSMFLGEYPFEFGGVGPVPKDRATISTILTEKNVRTAGFHSNPYLSRAYEFHRGFDAFYDSLSLGANRLTTFLHRVINRLRKQPYTRGKSINERGLSWLEDTRSSGDDQFLWQHYMDPHGPYQPPKKYQELFAGRTVAQSTAKKLWRRTVDAPESITGKERKLLIDLYDGEVRYTDEIIGHFIDELRERDLFEDSVIIIAADHGELFGEHDLYGHPRYLYDELVRVPLTIFGGQVTRNRIQDPVENIQIAPTILDAFGSESPSYFDSDSLFKHDNDSWNMAFSEASGEGSDSGVQRVGVRTANHHYLADTNTGDILNETLFAVEEDQCRRLNKDDHKQLIREFRRYLHSHLKSFDEAPVREDYNVDAAVEGRLEDLGYK